jgi:site-specific recombinase XerD
MDFHSHQKLSRALQKSKEECPDDYDVVHEFAEGLLGEGLSELRIKTYVIWLRKIRSVANKRLTEFDKIDVRKAINHYQLLCNSGKVPDSSVFEVKKTLKKFFKWMGKDDLVNWFSVGNVEKLSPADLITEEEFRRMLGSCFNSRDGALLSLLYETGVRVGEISTMKIKDVIFDSIIKGKLKSFLKTSISIGSCTEL